jgi:hypothetical protein
MRTTVNQQMHRFMSSHLVLCALSSFCPSETRYCSSLPAVRYSSHLRSAGSARSHHRAMQPLLASDAGVAERTQLLAALRHRACAADTCRSRRFDLHRSWTVPTAAGVQRTTHAYRIGASGHKGCGFQKCGGFQRVSGNSFDDDVAIAAPRADVVSSLCAAAFVLSLMVNRCLQFNTMCSPITFKKRSDEIEYKGGVTSREPLRFHASLSLSCFSSQWY